MSIPIPMVRLMGNAYYKVDLKFYQYAYDQSTSIVLYHTDDLTEEILCVPTVLLVDNKPAEGCVWIKDFSENEGVLDSLARAGIIQPTGVMCLVGHTFVYEAKILVPVVYEEM